MKVRDARWIPLPLFILNEATSENDDPFFQLFFFADRDRGDEPVGDGRGPLAQLDPDRAGRVGRQWCSCDIFPLFGPGPLQQHPEHPRQPAPPRGKLRRVPLFQLTLFHVYWMFPSERCRSTTAAREMASSSSSFYGLLCLTVWRVDYIWLERISSPHHKLIRM